MKTLIFTDGYESKYIKYSKKHKSYLPSLNKKQKKRDISKYNSAYIGETVNDLVIDIINDKSTKSIDHTKKLIDSWNDKEIPKLNHHTNNNKLTRNKIEKLNYKQIEFRENDTYKDMSLQNRNFQFFYSVPNLRNIDKIKKNNNIRIDKSISKIIMEKEDKEIFVNLVKDKVESNLKLNNKKYSLREVDFNYYFDQILEKISHKVELRNSSNKFISEEFVNNLINSEIDKIITGSSTENTVQVQLPHLPSIKSNILSKYLFKEYNDEKKSDNSHIETIGEESNCSLENTFSIKHKKIKIKNNPKNVKYIPKSIDQKKLFSFQDNLDKITSQELEKTIVENENNDELNNSLQENKIYSKLSKSQHENNNMKNKIQSNNSRHENNSIKVFQNDSNTEMSKENNNLNKMSHHNIYYINNETREGIEDETSKNKLKESNHILSKSQVIKTQLDRKDQPSESSNTKLENTNKIRHQRERLDSDYMKQMKEQKLIIKEENDNDQTKEKVDSLIENERFKPMITQSSNGFSFLEKEGEKEMKKTITSLLNKFRISTENFNSNMIDNEDNNEKDTSNPSTYAKQFSHLERKFDKQNTNIQKYLVNLPSVKEKKTENENNSTKRRNESGNNSILHRESHEDGNDENTENTHPNQKIKNKSVFDNNKNNKYSLQIKTTDSHLVGNSIILEGTIHNGKTKKNTNSKMKIMNLNKKSSFNSNLKKGSSLTLLKNNTMGGESLNSNTRSTKIKDYNNVVNNNEINDTILDSKNDSHTRSSRQNFTISSRNLKKIGTTKMSSNRESHQTLVNIENNQKIENVGIVVAPEIKTEVKKFVLSQDFFKLQKESKQIKEKSLDNILKEEAIQKGKKTNNNKTKSRILLFDDLDEIDKEVSDKEANPNISETDEILAIQNKLTQKNIDLDGLMKYKNFAQNLKINPLDKEKHNKIFGLLELIKQQEEIKKQKIEDKENLFKKYFHIKTDSNQTNSSQSNYQKDRIKSLSELQVELELRKKNSVLRNKVDQLVAQDENLNEELRKKKEQAYLLDVNQDINYLLLKIQSNDDNKKFKDLVEKMQSLQNYDAENFIKNISEIYKNFKYEELEIQNVIKIEERMNSFMNFFENFRRKNKRIKQLNGSKLKFVDATFDTTTGPILYK